MKTKKHTVAILVNREKDWEIMNASATLLEEFGIQVQRAIAKHTGVGREAVKLQDSGSKILIIGESSASSGARAAAAATIPVLVTPLQTKTRTGVTPLLEATGYDISPAGVLAIGVAGAKNAALAAISILSLQDTSLSKKYLAFRAKQTASVLKMRLD